MVLNYYVRLDLRGPKSWKLGVGRFQWEFRWKGGRATGDVRLHAGERLEALTA